MDTPSITLQPARVARMLGVIAGVLVTISLALQLVRYVGKHDHVYGLLGPSEKLFHVEHEQNLPTLFSVSLLLCVACLLAVISIQKRRQRDLD